MDKEGREFGGSLELVVSTDACLGNNFETS